MMPFVPDRTYEIIFTDYDVRVVLTDGTSRLVFTHDGLLKYIEALIISGVDAAVEESALMALERELNFPQRRPLA